jgi:D-glycero-D-manno-heptose 1,7-bisphosphate phosphatase
MPVRSHDSRRAVFLDRDGVLCEDTDYVTSFEKLRIFPFAKEAVALIHQKGYLAIVVTNQSAVARGMMTEEQLAEINGFLQRETGVDAVYYCPHLPPEHEEIPPYRIHCHCRKPDIGMLKRAAGDYGIALEQSYMVGDRASDIATGQHAGTRTVFISGGKPANAEADFVCASVLAFAEQLKP